MNTSSVTITGRPTVPERRWPDDRGSVGISSYFTIIAFLLLLGVGVAGMRTFIGQGDVSAAAHAAARAAALKHNFGAASSAAQSVANAELERTGMACVGSTVSITSSSSDFEPGGRVEVTVTCTVSYSGLFVPWSSTGSRVLKAQAVEPIDCLRGAGSAARTCDVFS